MLEHDYRPRPSFLTVLYRALVVGAVLLTLHTVKQTHDTVIALQADGQQVNQTIVEQRFALVEARTENKLLYDELVKVGNEKRAVEAEVNQLRLEAAEVRRNESLRGLAE